MYTYQLFPYIEKKNYITNCVRGGGGRYCRHQKCHFCQPRAFVTPEFQSWKPDALWCHGTGFASCFHSSLVSPISDPVAISSQLRRKVTNRGYMFFPKGSCKGIARFTSSRGGKPPIYTLDGMTIAERTIVLPRKVKKQISNFYYWKLLIFKRSGAIQMESVGSGKSWRLTEATRRSVQRYSDRVSTRFRNSHEL